MYLTRVRVALFFFEFVSMHDFIKPFRRLLRMGVLQLKVLPLVQPREASLIVTWKSSTNFSNTR